MKIRVDLRKNVDDSYDVEIGELSKKHFKKACIVTNPTVSGLHLEYLKSKISADELCVAMVPDGEEYKNMLTIEQILSVCFENRLDRSSYLIAFGGGVIGDMTGFAASIYERGCNFIQIPTTLLACVDASVGGKTGVNNKYGKNLVGAFYQPKGVYIDPHFFETLPAREFAAGVAEIVKMAVMFDKEFFGFLQNADLAGDKEALLKAVAKSVELKASVVTQDEKEHGVRAVLNYGHTFAHVIESETNYTGFLHGEAVAIGMVMANTLALKLGKISADDAKRVKELLEKYSLPTTYKIKDAESFYDKFFLDKKTKEGTIKFIIPSGIGSYEIIKDTPKNIVMEVLNEFLA
jgi:3-dehydroquinate synthase